MSTTSVWARRPSSTSGQVPRSGERSGSARAPRVCADGTLLAKPPYLVAPDKNATSAWIWVGLSVFEKVFGITPAE